MKVFLDQQGDAWHQFRKAGVGGSDVAKLMGSLPFSYSTVTNLWRDKMDLSTPFKMNSDVKFGMDNEDNARDFYELITGNVAEPSCHKSGEYDFMRVSLDGLTRDNTVLEIKVPSKNSWNVAYNGKVLDYYYSQMQYQMLVAESDMAHYWVFKPGYGALFFEVPRNQSYINEIVRRVSIFWNDYILLKKCPVPSDFGLDDRLYSDPYKSGEMVTSFIDFYRV